MAVEGRMSVLPKNPVGAVTLAVLWHKDGWRVFGPNGTWRRFDYKIDAEEAALRLAYQARHRSGEVRVLVQDQWGELHYLDAA
jgi:hypothetical protein